MFSAQALYDENQVEFTREIAKYKLLVGTEPDPFFLVFNKLVRQGLGVSEPIVIVDDISRSNTTHDNRYNFLSNINVQYVLILTIGFLFDVRVNVPYFNADMLGSIQYKNVLDIWGTSNVKQIVLGKSCSILNCDCLSKVETLSFTPNKVEPNCLYLTCHSLIVENSFNHHIYKRVVLNTEDKGDTTSGCSITNGSFNCCKIDELVINSPSSFSERVDLNSCFINTQVNKLVINNKGVTTAKLNHLINRFRTKGEISVVYMHKKKR